MGYLVKTESCITAKALNGRHKIQFPYVRDMESPKISKLTYWKHDASWEKGLSPDADHPPLIRWEMNSIACTSATTWLKALLELAEMECLPQRNSFDEYRIESSYKGALRTSKKSGSSIL